MRKIKSEQIVEQVKKLCIEASLYLGEDVLSCIKEKAKSEKSEVGKNILNILVENAEIAKEKIYQYAKILVWLYFLLK